MTELEQLEKILEGFQRIIGEISSWGPQAKAIQEHLDIINNYFGLMKDT